MIFIMIGAVLGIYLLSAAAFYAYMNLAAQPEPEFESMIPVKLEVVDGGFREETRRAA